MKLFSEEALDALEKGETIVSGAIEIMLSDPLRLWGGNGNITLGGHAFLGVGDRGMAQVSSGSLGGAEQGAELTLSGVDAAIIPITLDASLRTASVILWRLIFNGTGSDLLQASIFMRGKVDTLTSEETMGGTATLKLSVEGAARGLGRRSGRMRTDADQRLIIPTDTSFKHVSYAGEQTLYWGGEPPKSAANALPNAQTAVNTALNRVLNGS